MSCPNSKNPKDKNVVLKSSLPLDEIEKNFENVDVYSGIMQGLNEALKIEKSKSAIDEGQKIIDEGKPRFNTPEEMFDDLGI